jgi:iron(III) transport system permease protein
MTMISARVARQSMRLIVPGSLFAVLALLIVIPFAVLVYASLVTALPFSGTTDLAWTLENYRALWSPTLGSAVVNTLIVSLGGSALAMIFGCGMAWLAARTDIPCKPLVHIAGLMPLFVSLLVASVSWSLLGAGRSGYINIVFDSLGIPLRINMQSLGGIVLVHGLYYAPYPFIFLYSALSLIHPDLEEAAAVHGGDLHRILGRVTFPLVKPALLGSLLLIMVLMAEEFPVPQILGAPVGIETLSIRIYKLVNRVPSLPNQASAASIVLTMMVCVLVFVQHRVLRGRDYRTVTGKGIQVRPIALGGLRWVAVAFVTFYVFVAIVLPLFALMQSALRSNLYISNAAALFDISQFSLSHLTEAVTSPAVQQGLLNSLLAGVLAATFGSAFFFLLAYVVHRTDLPGRRLLEYLVMLPIAIPALVMGLGILWTWLAMPLPVYGTLAILVIAFVTRFMPQGYRAVSSSVMQIHDDLEQAALVAGATRLKALQKIILPLVRGGVAASFFLMIVLGMRELTASLFLYTTDTRLLSIVIYESYENGAWSSVASISLIYTCVLILLTVIGRRWMRAQL